jgi:beta-glucosidase-like glycosyl hydrolase
LDSHVFLPKVEHCRERLEKVEMEPFVAWARAGLGPIMTAHVIFTALDPLNPATVSRLIIKEELRGKLGFSHAVITDDLEMGAIGEIGGAARAALQAIEAEADALCISSSAETRESVQEALAQKALGDQAFAQRLTRAAVRLDPLGGFPGPRVDFSWLGSKEHEDRKSRLFVRLEKTK